jgi:transposase-like protein
MITKNRTCHNCQSQNIVLNGKNRSGNQRYRCKDCGVTRVLDSLLPHIDFTALEHSYLERNSLRATGRIFGISHVTVFRQLKKSAQRSEF